MARTALSEPSSRPSQATVEGERRARREAALRRIRKLGDPSLRVKALPVRRFDAYLKREARRMGELMEEAGGIGLAATQLGVIHRLFVYRVDSETALQVFVNPELVFVGAERETGEEGCLSIPGVQLQVERAVAVRVRAQDLKGRERIVEAGGLEARVIQHELDHLEGVLILDRVDAAQRREAMRALRQARLVDGREG